MASLLWPVQAPVSAPGPLEALLSRKQDSINLLTPPSDTDRHLRWRQANSEDIGTVHISEEALNQQRSRTEIQAVCFSPRDNIQAETPFFYSSVPFLIFFSAKKIEIDSDEMDLAESLERCPFWLSEFAPRKHSCRCQTAAWVVICTAFWVLIGPFLWLCHGHSCHSSGIEQTTNLFHWKG